MDSQKQRTEILTRWATLYHREMFRFALFRLGSLSNAEDCVQELFLKLLQGTTSLSEVRSSRSFLLRSLTNRCIDMRRHRKITLQPLSGDLQSADDITTIDEPERVNRMLATLPDDQAEVIRMRTCDALSFAEIADFESRLLVVINDHSTKKTTSRRIVWRLTAGAISIAATLLLVLNLAVTTPVQAAKESFSEAAEKIFSALKVWDKQLLKEACPFFDVELLRDRYYGCTVLEMQESVKSGLYAGEFVPVKVLFLDGEIETLMVALRNDNEQKSWVLDGGV